MRRKILVQALTAQIEGKIVDHFCPLCGEIYTASGIFYPANDKAVVREKFERHYPLCPNKLPNRLGTLLFMK